MSSVTKFAVGDFSPLMAKAAVQALIDGFELDPSEAVDIAPVDIDAIAEAAPEILIIDPADAAPLMAFRDELRSILPETHLVAFASRPSESLAKYCIDLEFRAFLSKSCPTATFLRAVEVVSRGGSFIDRNFGRAILADGTGGDCSGRLTSREESVLRLIAQGYSNSGVAGRLGLSTKTVDTHRARAMKKLSLPDRPALVNLASAAGWIG